MKEAIRHRALELGFDDCRCTTASRPVSASHFQEWLREQRHGEMVYLSKNAHKRVDPPQVLPGAKSIIVLAVNYGEAKKKDTEDKAKTRDSVASINRRSSRSERPHLGVIAGYAQYQDYHEVIGERLRSLSQFVNQCGTPGTRSLWYVDTGPVLERDLAQRAGLGFIGKHTNLISRRLGNWIFLAEILTTLELAPDPSEPNRCGSCDRCLSACPTRAIIAPFQLDARRCISYLTIELKGSIPIELRTAIGNRIYGCDDCLAACPWNRFAQEASIMRDHSRPDLARPALLDLLTLDEAGFKHRFAETPLLRVKRRGLLRNVCVALGNTGDATVLPQLERAASDPEPLISEHAHWAIGQIRNRISHDDAGSSPN